MPSFYATALPPPHMSSITPEHGSKYGYNSYSGATDLGTYGSYANLGAHDLSALSSEPYDPYKAVAAPSATLFPSNNFNSISANPPVHRSTRVNTQHRPHADDSHRHRHHHGHSAKEPKVKEEQVVGGVSAKLDYQMEMMTDFVSEMATGMYDLCMSHICIADIDLVRSIKPGSIPNANFRKWVLHVLNATRLPSATILTSLHYLSIRVRSLSTKGLFNPTQHDLYQLLTVALILGSKFLDDNTFQNKSWAEVSSIKVSELNHEEREWLAAFGHRLHYHPQCPDGFFHWQEKWENFQIHAVSAQSALFPVDSNAQRQHSVRSASHRKTPSPIGYPTQYAKLPTQSYDNSYPTPTATPYDGWFPQRTATEKSPSTAPHTGPPTPEYYGAPSIWSHDNFAQRAHFGYPSLSSIPPQPAPYPTPYTLPYPNHYGWCSHDNNSECYYCPKQALPPYMLPPRYGPTVAG